MLEAKYKRDLNQNYLILPGNEKDSYQIQMLKENEVSGLLPLQVRIINNQTELYYDISSKQPLNRLFEKQEITFDVLSKIFLSLEETFDETQLFLLDSRYVYINPEYIYCSPESMKISWLFYPYIVLDKMPFESLADFFLERIDHSDTKAVEIAYAFFKFARNESFVIKQIIELMDELGERESCLGIVDEIKGNEVQRQDKCSEKIDTAFDFADNDYDEEELRHETEKGWWEKLFGKKKKKSQEQFLEKESTEKRGISNNLVYVEAVPEQKTNYGETMVVSCSENQARKVLRGKVKGRTVELSLQKMPCTIGKMEGQVDIVLKSNSVSRIHARFFEEENRVYLKDENSTNGTFKNNLRLEANEIVEVDIGDEISFADVTFIYE